MESGCSGCRRSLFQLCVAAGLHLRHISEAHCSRVLVVAASSVAGIWIRRDLRCDLLSDPGSVARPRTAPARAPPLLCGVRRCVRFACASQSSSLAPLPGFHRARSGWQWDGASCLLRRADNVVPAETWCCVRPADVGWGAGSDGPASGRAVPDWKHRLARRVRHLGLGGPDHRTAARGESKAPQRSTNRIRSGPSLCHARPAVLDFLDHPDSSFRGLTGSECFYRAPCAATDRSRSKRRRRGNGSVCPRRLHASRAAGHRLAARSLLCPACSDVSPLCRVTRDVYLGWSSFPCYRLCWRCSHRFGYGWRGGHNALSAQPLLWLELVLYLVRL